MFKLGRTILAAVGIFFLVGGWAYGHSDEFKLRCTMQKLGDKAALSFPQNVLCDAMFDIGTHN